MLKCLKINNLAIIENAEVSFENGFTVLTGATGAGKSLLIDSLSLLLGSRASSELIRQGEEKATIVGEFELDSSYIKAILTKLEIPFTEDSLVIERTIRPGKSTVKANGVALSLASLQTLTNALADIHNQFDFAKMVDPTTYLPLLDEYGQSKIEAYLTSYRQAYETYLDEQAELDKLLQQKKEIEARRDFYSYQYDELKGAALYEGEEEELERELSLLKNYDKVYSLNQQANELAHDDFLDKLYELQKIVGNLASYQSQYGELSKGLEDKYYELDDLVASLKKELGNLDYDPTRLDTLLQRESDLASLKRKYKKEYNDLILYRDELKGYLDSEKYSDEALNIRKKAVDEAKSRAYSKAKDLSSIRQSIAKSIEKEMGNALKDLLLEVKFKVAFTETELSVNGLDEVSFLIETNLGEGLKNLDKVVSGGEASRVMLAFKSLLIKAKRVGTVIFDEIDTGISGKEAEAVARKIKEISLSTQVIAITHLPQVAALSDHHILISKEVNKGRTYAHIKTLDLNGKIEEVAHLISGEKITKTQLEYAKEMVLGKEG